MEDIFDFRHRTGESCQASVKHLGQPGRPTFCNRDNFFFENLNIQWRNANSDTSKYYKSELDVDNKQIFNFVDASRGFR
jgi:hypothetical protein